MAILVIQFHVKWARDHSPHVFEVSRLIHFTFLIPQLSSFHPVAIIIERKKTYPLRSIRFENIQDFLPGGQWRYLARRLRSLYILINNCTLKRYLFFIQLIRFSYIHVKNLSSKTKKRHRKSLIILINIINCSTSPFDSNTIFFEDSLLKIFFLRFLFIILKF